MLVSLPLRLLHRKSFRRVQPFFEARFVRTIVPLVQIISDTQLTIYLPQNDAEDLTLKKFQRIFGDDGSTADSSGPNYDLLIANHQIYSDWIYLWGLMDRIDRAGDVKIIMKRSLRNVPIIGWSMRFFDFIFLNRKWEQDQIHFAKKLQGYLHSKQPFCLLIYPEGTTLNNSALKKSESFAFKLGVKPTSRVLLPRVLGLWEAVRTLDGSFEGIYDITVGYSGLSRTDEPEKVYSLRQLFYAGFAPKTIHYHLKYIPLKDIPRSSADEFGNWLRERYYEKDRLLDIFYETGSFPHSKSVRKRLCPRYYVPLVLLQTALVLSVFILPWLIPITV